MVLPCTEITGNMPLLCLGVWGSRPKKSKSQIGSCSWVEKEPKMVVIG